MPRLKTHTQILLAGVGVFMFLVYVFYLTREVVSGW